MKVDFYRYGKHVSLMEIQEKSRQTLVSIDGLKGWSCGLRMILDCDHILARLQGEFHHIWVFDSSRKKLIEIMYQKSKEIMK